MSFSARAQIMNRQETQSPASCRQLRPFPYLEDRLFAPRRGQSFSLQLPQAQPQRRWMEHLPWDVVAHVRSDRLADLRAALGCEGDTDETNARFAQALDAIANGQLLLRIIELCPRYPIPPGETMKQCRARLDRWLPPNWEADLETMTLRWTKPTRFACPTRNFQLPPSVVPLGTNTITPCDRDFACTDSVARWLPSGEIWVFVAGQPRIGAR